MKIKRYLLLGLILLLSFSLIACSNNPFSSSDDEKDEELVIKEINIEKDLEEYRFTVNVDGDVSDYKWAVEVKDDGEAGEIIEGQESSEMHYKFAKDNPATSYEVTVWINGDVSKSKDFEYDREEIEEEIRLIVSDIKVETRDGSLRIQSGDSINLWIEAEDKEGDDDFLKYTWSRKIGDEDEFEEIRSGYPDLSHVRIEEGNVYTYQVEVETADGEQSITREIEIEVQRATAEIVDYTFTPQKGSIHAMIEEVDINVEARDPNPDGEDENLSYVWDVNTGHIEVDNDDPSRATYPLPDDIEAGDTVVIYLDITTENGDELNERFEFEVQETPTELEEIIVPEMPEVDTNVRLEVHFAGMSDGSLSWYVEDEDEDDGWKNIAEDENVISHLFDETGVHKIKVEYIGTDGEIMEEIENVTVKAPDPSIDELNAIPSNEAMIGDEITLSANVHETGGYEIKDYSWEIIEGVGQIKSAQDSDSIVYTSDEPGSATVRLTVENHYWGTDSWEKELEFKSNPAEIDGVWITVDAADIDEQDAAEINSIEVFNDDLIKLRAQAHDPDDLGEVEYSWRVGHREIGRGQEIDYKAVNEGFMPQDEHTIRLYVRDSMGAEVSKEVVRVELNNRAPEIISVVGVDDMAAGAERRFSVTAEDPDGESLNYYWEASAGTIDTTGRTVEYKAPSASNENVEIKVTVEDASGESDVWTDIINITEGELSIRTLHSHDDSLAIGEQTTITVDVSDPEENVDYNYDWNAEHGSIEGSSSNVTYTAPDSATTDTISVTVTDSNNTTRSVSSEIEIEIFDAWTETYAIGELQAGVEQAQRGYALVGNSGDQWSILEIDRSGEIDDLTTGDGFRSSNNVFNDLVRVDGDYILAGDTGSLGYLRDRAQDETRVLGSSLEGIESFAGGYVVAGEDSGSGYLARRGSDLAGVWAENYGSRLNALAVDDNLIFAAGVMKGTFSAEAYLVVVNADGEAQWSKEYSDYSSFTDLKATADGGAILTTDDGELVKVDDEGTVQWSTDYASELNAVIESGTGYLAVGSNSSGAYVVKTDSDGKEEWSESFSSAERFNGAIRVSDGYLLFGTDGSRQFVAKVDRNGNSSQ